MEFSIGSCREGVRYGGDSLCDREECKVFYCDRRIIQGPPGPRGLVGPSTDQTLIFASGDLINGDVPFVNIKDDIRDNYDNYNNISSKDKIVLKNGPSILQAFPVGPIVLGYGSNSAVSVVSPPTSQTTPQFSACAFLVNQPSVLSNLKVNIDITTDGDIDEINTTAAAYNFAVYVCLGQPDNPTGYPSNPYNPTSLQTNVSVGGAGGIFYGTNYTSSNTDAVDAVNVNPGDKVVVLVTPTTPAEGPTPNPYPDIASGAFVASVLCHTLV